jgi:uncharacterized protein (TIGR00369 family)
MLICMKANPAAEQPRKITKAAAAADQPALQALHCGCFACGAANPAGLHLQYEVTADGRVTARWNPTATFRSYEDRIHGGVLATLLDSAMVHALFATGVVGVTAELTIRYLHSIQVGSPVEVSGWVKSNRFGIYLCAAEIRQAGVIAVKAAAKFMALTAASAAP